MLDVSKEALVSIPTYRFDNVIILAAMLNLSHYIKPSEAENVLLCIQLFYIPYMWEQCSTSTKCWLILVGTFISFCIESNPKFVLLNNFNYFDYSTTTRN